MTLFVTDGVVAFDLPLNWIFNLLKANLRMTTPSAAQNAASTPSRKGNFTFNQNLHFYGII
ncbi:hypothetical protein [Petrotoga sp. 9PW.55.5.1]|uniref:hypothetical protein n=1 Tax=Petrotoga sp. 9PW.55.5.1 TaxID=1308979 RepID=UPI0013146E25|nr:hypothetical protein [Petrotoga sp. 9PW.55.5.1]